MDGAIVERLVSLASGAVGGAIPHFIVSLLKEK
jgi:hypothetical protein